MGSKYKVGDRVKIKEVFLKTNTNLKKYSEVTIKQVISCYTVDSELPHNEYIMMENDYPYPENAVERLINKPKKILPISNVYLGFISECPHCYFDNILKDPSIGDEITCNRCGKTFIINEFDKTIEE
jgi:hypothetical protein